MNRQTKRLMQRQGADKPRAPEQRQKRPQAATVTGPKEKRTTPRQYVSEARAELRKVAWPSRLEVRNSTIAVLACVVVVTAFIFAVDYGSSKFVLFLFG